MNSIDQIIDLKVKITNLLDQTTVGTIYALSPKQNVLALKIPPSHSTKAGSPPSEDVFKVINSAFIKSISVLSPIPKKSTKPSQQVTSKIDIAKLEAQLNKILNSSKTQNSPAIAAQATPSNSTVNKRAETSPLALKVFDSLCEKLGKENVQWQGNESILLFKEIGISKPYALNKISVSKKGQSSKHLDKVKRALREVWLSSDSSRRGG